MSQQQPGHKLGWALVFSGVVVLSLRESWRAGGPTWRVASDLVGALCLGLTHGEELRAHWRVWTARLRDIGRTGRECVQALLLLPQVAEDVRRLREEVREVREVVGTLRGKAGWGEEVLPLGENRPPPRGFVDTLERRRILQKHGYGGSSQDRSIATPVAINPLFVAGH